MVSRTKGEVCPEGGIRMKDRERQRKNRKLKHKEERIGKKDYCGVKDLTIYNAVEQIRTGGKAAIALR